MECLRPCRLHLSARARLLRWRLAAEKSALFAPDSSREPGANWPARSQCRDYSGVPLPRDGPAPAIQTVTTTVLERRCLAKNVGHHLQWCRPTLSPAAAALPYIA